MVAEDEGAFANIPGSTSSIQTMVDETVYGDSDKRRLFGPHWRVIFNTIWPDGTGFHQLPCP